MADETAEYRNLIGSDKVQGTAVYGANGESIGTIERVMIDKKTGKVSFAVLGFGGFMGIGNEHYPLSWNMLTYNADLGGYEASVTEEELRGAPKYEQEGDWDWNNPERPSAVESYYSGLWGTRRLDERP